MRPEDRARKLKKEADELLDSIALAKLCKPIGELIPTGSYFLDLMMYPDIDLYLPPAKPRLLFDIAASLVENEPVTRVNFLNGGPGELKNALYIKPVIAVGDWERAWKIDIWAADLAFIEKKNKELEELGRKMTPQQRHLSLEYKFSVLNAQGRTPMYSGIHIYRAVVEHGLCEFEEITQYLRKNSIDV